MLLRVIKLSKDLLEVVEVQTETLIGVLQLVIVMMVVVVVAVLVMNVVVELNVFSRLARARKRLLLGLLASCLLAPSVTYSVIATLRDKSGVNSENLYPLLLLISPIVHVADVLRFAMPLSLALFGVEAGLIYSGVALLRALMRLGIHILVVRSRYRDLLSITLSKLREALLQVERHAAETPVRERVKIGLIRGLRTLKKILPRLAIAAVIVVVLTGTNVMEYLASVLNPVLSNLGLTESMIIVIVTQAIHYMSGMYIAAALFNEGHLTLKQLIIAMLAGAMIRTIVLHLRSYLPVRSAFFTFRVALRWTLFDISTSILTCIAAILLVIFLPIS